MVDLATASMVVWRIGTLWVMGWRVRHSGSDVGFCHECGEGCTLVSRPSLVERVRHFLVYGMPAPDVWVCPNGHETGGRVGVTLVLRRPSGLRVFRVGLRMVREVREARSMEPVPLTYLMAAGVGVVAGFGFQWWLGWAWWIVALGVIAGAWLFFLSTAFWPSNRRHLIRQLRSVVDPEGARRRELDAVAALVGSGIIDTYGVAGWVGPVRLSWSGSDTEVRSVSLVHFDASDAAEPVIEVEYHSASRHSSAALADNVRESFAENSIDMPPSTQPGDFARRVTQGRWEAHQQLPSQWQDTTIEIDDTPVTFAMLQRPGAFAAITSIADGHIVVHAERCEPGSFALVRVTDITPYAGPTLD